MMKSVDYASTGGGAFLEYIELGSLPCLELINQKNSWEVKNEFLENIEEIAQYLVADGKGFLAADESTPTIGKRFDAINTESTETSRRDYRELLFRAKGMKDNISGVILFDETLRQSAADDTPLKEVISSTGALPGIKVDKGVTPFNDTEEVLTGGLEGLEDRRLEYETPWSKIY